MSLSRSVGLRIEAQSMKLDFKQNFEPLKTMLVGCLDLVLYGGANFMAVMLAFLLSTSSLYSSDLEKSGRLLFLALFLMRFVIGFLEGFLFRRWQAFHVIAAASFSGIFMVSYTHYMNETAITISDLLFTTGASVLPAGLGAALTAAVHRRFVRTGHGQKG